MLSNRERITEEKDYEVTLTIRATTIVRFAPIERDGPINGHDAIENAIGSTFALDVLENEGFQVAYPIEGEATEL